jgi:hypothetical protein
MFHNFHFLIRQIIRVIVKKSKPRIFILRRVWCKTLRKKTVPAFWDRSFASNDWSCLFAPSLSAASIHQPSRLCGQSVLGRAISPLVVTAEWHCLNRLPSRNVLYFRSWAWELRKNIKVESARKIKRSK